LIASHYTRKLLLILFYRETVTMATYTEVTRIPSSWFIFTINNLCEI